MEFIGHLVLTGKIECLSGFMTHGSLSPSRVAATDLPILRNPITQLPYIPGSLFKGKLRSLVELCYANELTTDETRNDGICVCGQYTCKVCPLFGVEHDKGTLSPGCRPARLRFVDLLPTPDTQALWQSLQEETGTFTQTKAENAVDRLSRAANPRLIERVPPGSCFQYEIHLGLYHFPECSADRLADLDKLTVLEMALQLLNADSLGWHGSRGSGQVRVHPGPSHFVSRHDYHRQGHSLATQGSLTHSAASFTPGHYAEDISTYLDQVQASPRLPSVVSKPAGQPGQADEIETYMVRFRPYHSLMTNVLHSDTLFGALAWALRVVHAQNSVDQDGAALLAELLHKDTHLRLSSVFPYIQRPGGQRLFLLPRPIVAPLPQADKAFRKWAYASVSVWNDLINNRLTEEQLYDAFYDMSSDPAADLPSNATYVSPDGTFLLERDEYEECRYIWHTDPQRGHRRRLFAEADLTRTSISRISGGAADNRLFFSQELLTTAAQSGYFFLIRAPRSVWQVWRERLATTLAFLADRGLGGDTSAGRGKLADISWERFTQLEEPTQAQRFVTLSLYYPNAAEIPHLDKAWYQLLPRKGKVDTTYLASVNPFKARIQMFVEGSTFPWPQSTPLGHNPCVQSVRGPEGFVVRQWGRPFVVRMVGA